MGRLRKALQGLLAFLAACALGGVPVTAQGPEPPSSLLDAVLLDLSYLWLLCGTVTFLALCVVLGSLVLRPRRGRRR
ncbi:MAG: hypothetical protein ACP5UM_05810 [Anaerolineae bacterium]